MTAFAAILVLGAVVVAPALASGKPFVETKLDTNVGETKATLNGIVNPNGAATKYYFEYGTTIAYGSKTAEVSVGSGTSNLEENKALTGLTPNKTYHFRIVATNSNGTSDGADEVFYTSSVALPEFKPVPTKKAFTSTSGAVTWRLAAVGTITCSKSTTSGEITGPNTLGKVVMKFTGCQMTVSDGTCEINSTNTKNKGELVTNSLRGGLGTVATAQAASGVGLLLEAESGDVIWDFASTEPPCERGEGVLEGTFAGEVSPLAEKQLTSKLDFEPQLGSAKQKIKEITVKSGPEKPKLHGYDVETSLEKTDEVKFEEALEVT